MGEKRGTQQKIEGSKIKLKWAISNNINNLDIFRLDWFFFLKKNTYFLKKYFYKFLKIVGYNF